MKPPKSLGGERNLSHIWRGRGGNQNHEKLLFTNLRKTLLESLCFQSCNDMGTMSSQSWNSGSLPSCYSDFVSVVLRSLGHGSKA